MAKQIVFNSDARQRMLKGINLVAATASVTLGPRGRCVMIQHQTDGISPVTTRDGRTVADGVNLDDPIANVGARMLKDVAGGVSRAAGDGTTTAIVLAQSMANDVLKFVTAGANSVKMGQGMIKAVRQVADFIDQQTITESSSDIIRKVAAVASKEDQQLGDLLVEAFDAVGADGSVHVQMGDGREDELIVVEGIEYGQGYLSPYFNTDKQREIAELHEPYLLYTDYEITDFMDLVPLLEAVKEDGRSLLILSDGMTEKALAGLLLNHVRGTFTAVAVKAPGFGDRIPERLRDLAALTGGKVFLKDCKESYDQATLADLGSADKAVITAESTTIIGGMGDKAAVAARLTGLQVAAADIRALKPGQGSHTGNMHDLGELEARVEALQGKTATYRVGGVTDVEIKERMVRVSNAIHSVQAALEQGTVVGGGIALFRAACELGSGVRENTDYGLGVEVIRRALHEPLRHIAVNSGMNGNEVIAQIQLRDDAHFGYDAKSGEYGDLLDQGVIDSVKVLKLALQNAVSVVTTMMSTEAIVTTLPEADPLHGYTPEWAASTREDPRAD